MSRERGKKGKNKEFTVCIYESEYQQIQAWVDKYQNLETGGDLFGLWSDDHTAVVQLVLGPGKHCSRTPTSFYQDVEYLERVGNLLTNEGGLCHIGEWHSHHRLGLKQPSGGDENTVWNNMDRYGIHRFCLFIATIDRRWTERWQIENHVDVNGFLFKINREKNRYRQVMMECNNCNFKQIEDRSPFRLKYTEDMKIGAESVNNTHEDQSQPSKNYVPNENKKHKKGNAEYQALELQNVVEDEEPEATKGHHERSGICCSCWAHICPMCFLVNCTWAWCRW